MTVVDDAYVAQPGADRGSWTCINLKLRILGLGACNVGIGRAERDPQAISR